MDLPAGFELASILEREDPRDAFVSNHFADLQALPQGARVGTSSLRRVVQLKSLRPDLQIEPLRGNLDTRLRKLDEGGYDAIVLAAAGLKRLGLAQRVRALFPVDQMIPCAGQGALGLEVRDDATVLKALLATLTHRASWLATQAERAVSRQLGGSCSVPLAAHAVWQGEQLQLSVALGHAEQAEAPLLRASLAAAVLLDEQALALGTAAAQALREQGGERYLASH
jgi:hydroxymethylbilane synthase